MTALLVATPGGHLAELWALAPRIEAAQENRVWVCPRTEQSESLLEGEQVEWISGIGMRDARGVVKAATSAPAIIRRRGASTIISTGAGSALAFLPVGAARGIPTHYIESATRTSGPSVTGAILRWTPGVKLYTQHSRWADERWRYRGSIFDGFRPSHRPRASPLRRAVVTLGTMRSYQFPRLLAKLSQIIPPEVDVLWQTGSTPVADLPIVANPWVPADELASAMTSADVIVGHCGSGTAIGALKSGSYAVLVPRHSGRGENVDDHQIALAQDLSARGLACTPSVEELTLAHLEQAATRRVERNAEPPPFELD